MMFSDAVFRHASYWVFIAVMGLMLGACAQLERLQGPSDVTQASPEWLEAQKTKISARAEARWAALAKGDYTRAYTFQSPSYRSVFSAQQYQGEFGNAVVWQLARAKSVKYDQNNVAHVTIEVEYLAPVGLAGDVKGVRQMVEKWLYSEGAWWYISQ